MVRCALLALLVACSAPAGARADAAEVVGVAAAPEGGGLWRFDVAVRHADAGWEHYADAWRVVGPDGATLGERTLVHPHDDEQPFTRSLSGVAIPPGVDAVRVEARDSVHGWGPAVDYVVPR